MEQKKSKIGNVGVLDLLDAEPESLEQISSIMNAGYVVMHQDIVPFFLKISLENVGAVDTLPVGCRMVKGQLKLDKDVLSGAEDLRLFVKGTLTVDFGVEPGMLKQALSFLRVKGKIFCPENVRGELSLLLDDLGKSIISITENDKLITGDVNLNDEFFSENTESTRIIIDGEAAAIEKITVPVPAGIGQIRCLGAPGRFLEGNWKLLKQKIIYDDSRKPEIIPEGYAVLDEEKIFDTASLTALKNPCVYTHSRIIFLDDISREKIVEKGLKIITDSEIVCPGSLLETISELTEGNIKALLPYEGKALLITGSSTLTPEELTFREGPFTLWNRGKFTISDGVSLEELKEKLKMVYNFGKIIASEEICGLLRVKARVNKGRITTPKDESERDEELDAEFGIGNVGHLKL